MLSGFLKRLEIACFLEFVLKSLTQRLYNPHLLKYCCLGNLVGNNQLTGGDTYDGWLLTKTQTPPKRNNDLVPKGAGCSDVTMTNIT